MIIIKPKTSIGRINSLLNRIGIPNHSSKKLYTTAVLIRQPDSSWGLFHFKEILEVISPDDGIKITDEDLDRLDNIAKILMNFDMIETIPDIEYSQRSGVRILKVSDLQENGGEWEVVRKFTSSPSKIDRFFEILDSKN